ncbi:MAG: magnesium transporter [Chlamydiae bacterium]|nr:magnesium transporter [Chlamydiota bacterium]
MKECAHGAVKQEKPPVKSSLEARLLRAQQLDRLLAERIDKAFHKQTSYVCLDNLIAIATEHSPVDLAQAASMLPSSIRPLLFENFKQVTHKIQFIIHTDSATRIAIFRHISDDETKELLEGTADDDIPYMIDDMSERRYRKILELLDAKKAAAIKELTSHSRNSARRLMSTEFFAFDQETTLGEVAEIIRENPGVEFTKKVFVVDAEEKLLGYISARQMIVNPPYVKLKDIARPATYVVYPDSTREEVVEMVQRYKISGLPVVNEERELVGVIADEDIIEAVEDMADMTIACMTGTGEKASEPVESVFKRFLCRAPWLLVTLLAGFLNMSVMNVFQQYEGFFLTFIFFFVPLVTGMSGNIGLQSSAILVRNIALGLLSKETRREMMIREISLGLFTGAIFGLLSGFFVAFLHVLGVVSMSLSPAVLGLIVGIGLFGACITGTLLGVVSPIFFLRVGIDPAVSSGPIVTAFNDFLSMSIYFVISIFLMRLFV